MTDEAEQFIKQYAEVKFELFRKPIPKSGKKSKGSTSRKYVCPCCGAIVRATKEVKIICGECYSPDEDPVYLEEEI